MAQFTGLCLWIYCVADLISMLVHRFKLPNNEHNAMCYQIATQSCSYELNGGTVNRWLAFLLDGDCECRVYHRAGI